MNYDRYAKTIYAWNLQVGWWDDPNRCLYQTLQLVSTEVAEATEGERKDLMDDHIPTRKMGEVELADALIRILDFGAHMKLKVSSTMQGHEWASEEGTIGKKHLAINRMLMTLVEAYEEYDECNNMGDSTTMMGLCYSCTIHTIADVAKFQGYDLEAATIDKMLYNQTRLDHTREHRAHFDGKKF
jgi:hypothetical protein